MNNDLISRSEAEKLGATCLARRNENGQLEAIISLDEAPTVDLWKMRQEATENALKKAEVLYKRPQGEWIIVKDERYGDNVKCPFCGKELAGTDLNFCCKCGAKLIGSEKMNGGME